VATYALHEGRHVLANHMRRRQYKEDGVGDPQAYEQNQEGQTWHFGRIIRYRVHRRRRRARNPRRLRKGARAVAQHPRRQAVPAQSDRQRLQNRHQRLARVLRNRADTRRAAHHHQKPGLLARIRQNANFFQAACQFRSWKRFFYGESKLHGLAVAEALLTPRRVFPSHFQILIFDIFLLL
jgi:hypothetical protein